MSTGMGTAGIHPDPLVAMPASHIGGRTLAVAVALAGLLVGSRLVARVSSDWSTGRRSRATRCRADLLGRPAPIGHFEAVTRGDQVEAAAA